MAKRKDDFTWGNFCLGLIVLAFLGYLAGGGFVFNLLWDKEPVYNAVYDSIIWPYNAYDFGRWMLKEHDIID